MCCARREGLRISSRTSVSDANLDCAFVLKALVSVITKIWKGGLGPLGRPPALSHNTYILISGLV